MTQKPRWRESDLNRLGKVTIGDQVKQLPTKKANKYKNIKVEVDGIKFDSQREAGHYLKLKMMQQGGLISELKMQVEYPLKCNEMIVNGEIVKLPYQIKKSWIADFTYIENGILKVIDVKGYKTKSYKLAKILIKKLYNIDIIEV
jgi:hypothetical protein